MAYEMVQNGATQFAIDWGVVHRLLRSYWTACLQYKTASEVKLSDSHWYNPLSWSLPEVTHVEVDWSQVHRDAQSNADDELRWVREQAKSSAANVATYLEQRVGEAAQYKEQYVDWIGEVQTDNMQRIEHAVDDYQSHVEVAKFVRGMAAEGLMVGASVMSGGAALSVMATGSFLKGTGKFQDTGSLGAGAMEAAGTFAFAYVKLGKKFSFKQDMVLALVQAPWKAGTELVGGATLTKAALSGGLKLTGPGVERLFTRGAGGMIFDKLAVPVVITYNGTNEAAKVLGKWAAKGVQSQGVEKWARDRLLSPGSSNAAPPARPQEKILDQATLTNKLLLYLAYVNMDKGIGRGW